METLFVQDLLVLKYWLL